MARKAKKRMHQMPPLSVADKLIYWTVLLILCSLSLLLLFGTLWLRRQIAFADEMVIAKGDHISMCWFLIPWMTFSVMTFILWLLPYQSRMPLFGRRNFRYGPPAWPKTYPLFMKDRPRAWVSERVKRNRKVTVLLLLAVLLISFIPFPWALYGRDCLRSDGSIAQYSMFNTQVHEFPSGQIASVEIEAYRYSSGKYNWRKHWGVRLTLTTDSGKTYAFDQRAFRSDAQGDTPYWLSAMLRLKGRYDPQIITYSGLEKLENVILDKHLSEDQAELLYRLFGQSGSGA